MTIFQLKQSNYPIVVPPFNSLIIHQFLAWVTLNGPVACSCSSLHVLCNSFPPLFSRFICMHFKVSPGLNPFTKIKLQFPVWSQLYLSGYMHALSAHMEREYTWRVYLAEIPVRYSEMDRTFNTIVLLESEGNKRHCRGQQFVFLFFPCGYVYSSSAVLLQGN